MPSQFLISVFCEDSPGLIAAISGRLFDLGGNLGDTTFAALSGAAELSAVCELPASVGQATVEGELKALPELARARISVQPFSFQPRPSAASKVTHRVEVAGADMPGLIARMSEAFAGYGANIVRLTSRQERDLAGTRYLLRMAVWVPPEKVDACLATVANTAAELKLACRVEPCDSLEEWFGVE
jgi:glycine cleavage system transcriptional repressor